MKTYFVDAFTNLPFKGNPAAVCIAEGELDEGTMQSIATEIGFSETAFIRVISEGLYGIRFFTPKQEIPLCGHATLAASKILFDTTGLQSITFRNEEGVELPIGQKEGRIVMRFPVYDTEEITVPQAVLAALGIERVVDTRYSAKNKIILIHIEDPGTLAGLRPDFPALLRSYSGINGVLVTAPAQADGFDFHYRYFWPWAGTEEDPVTGGVQTFLTKYWAQRLGKNRLEAFQSSARTGRMTTELLGDSVAIYGEAVTVLEGMFNVHI